MRKRSGRRKERGLREWPFIVQRPFFRQTAAAFSGENDVGGDGKFVTFLLSNVSLNRLRSDFRQGFISFPFLPEADVERKEEADNCEVRDPISLFIGAQETTIGFPSSSTPPPVSFRGCGGGG